MVKIFNPLITFSSTVPSLLMKDALSSALYVALIVNYWVPPIMISHKRYFLATHPKLQAIISKSLTHRLIISYPVRDLTNENKFFHQLISKSEFNQQFYFLQSSIFCFTYIFNVVISYFILPGTFRYISIWRSCNFVCLCFFCPYFYVK